MKRGTVTNQTGGSGAGSQAFPYLCSDGSRTHSLLWADIDLSDLWIREVFLVNVRPFQTACA